MNFDSLNNIGREQIELNIPAHWVCTGHQDAIEVDGNISSVKTPHIGILAIGDAEACNPPNGDSHITIAKARQLISIHCTDNSRGVALDVFRSPGWVKNT